MRGEMDMNDGDNNHDLGDCGIWISQYDGIWFP